MRILFDGMECFEEYKRILKSAKKSIWICMYMIRFDNRTKEIWKILEQKYQEGVDVKVKFDMFGCFRSIPRLIFYPFCEAFIPSWFKLSSRNHAKLLLVDNKVGIVTGRNLTKRYFEEWVDTATIIDEPALIKDLIEFTNRIEFQPIKRRTHEDTFMITDPFTKNRSVYNFILENIVKAKKEITILSPYFVIDDAIESLLLAAADRGVKITIIVPAKPEHRLAVTFNRINFQRIFHRNVHVMRSKGMFHSKVMLFDDVALIGSANFDNRSFKWNYELSVAVDKKHIKNLQKHVQDVADHSVKYNKIQRAYDTLLFNLTRHLMEFL